MFLGRRVVPRHERRAPTQPLNINVIEDINLIDF
jgi:hypothetical protein